jgi:RNA polymerase sigma-70 factor, ECF subfamily
MVASPRLVPDTPRHSLISELDRARGNRPLGDPAIVERALSACVARARKAWPDITLDDRVFVRTLGRVLTTDDVATELTALNAADLYLACACIAGDAQAQRAFSRHHLGRVREWVAHVDRNEAFAEDVRQEASRKLLLSADHGPKLADYSGRGALGAFVRVFVTRLARKMVARSPAYRHDARPVNLAAAELDPEVALLRRRYAREFADAFKATLVGLDADERNVLKLHYIDGLSIAEVGTTYHVSRATAARLLAKAKARIVHETKEALARRLGRSAPGAETLFAIVESQLGASFVKFFRP